MINQMSNKCQTKRFAQTLLVLQIGANEQADKVQVFGLQRWYYITVINERIHNIY